MKKLLSINYNAWHLIYLCWARLVFGLLMLFTHGLTSYRNSILYKQIFTAVGLGHKTSLVLAIFAELFCSLFYILAYSPGLA